jgi:hypothetical protein
VRSAEEIAYYDDIRYKWDVREAGNLSLWTHDRTDSFAARAFEIAMRALDEQQTVFGLGLEQPIRIMVYNTQAEFAAWHPSSTELIGGEAFPALGITTQIVDNSAAQDAWLNYVLPHEISHLYFYQVTYHALAPVPAWLDEGVAQYNEFGSKEGALQRAKDDILSGKYIPLRGLTGGFGVDEEKFNRSYDESRSAVNYLMETYGGRGLSDLLKAYKSGLPTEQAFPAALGITVEQFESEWLRSLGLPEGMLPTPLSTEAVALGPAALTPSPTQSATRRPVGTPSASAPTITPTTLAVTICLGFGCPLVLLLALVWLIRPRKAKAPDGGG